MLPAENIRKMFNRLGYDENRRGKRLFLLPILMSTLKIAICTSTCLCITFNWKRYEDKRSNQIYLVMSAKDINLVLTVLVFSLEYIFATNRMKDILSMIDKELPRFKKEFPKSQRDLIMQSRSEQISSLNMTKNLLCVSIGIIAVLPGFVSIYMIYKKSLNGINIIDLPLPFVSWYPKNYETIYTYMIIYMCQVLLLVDSLGLGFCMFGSAVAAFQTLVLEMKLFCANVERINATQIDCNNNFDVQIEQLRDYTSFLVRCHQEIIRYVKLTTRCVGGPVSYTNQDMCFQICAYIFCIAEVDNKFAKFAYFVLTISIVVILLIYCYKGQNVINSGEELRECLYRCSWLGKPKWFQIDLHIMMVMAEVPLQIKPFGLYVLNLSTFTTIMNASYSYFNVLKTIRKK